MNSTQWNSNAENTEICVQKGKERLPTSPKRLQFSEAGSSKQISKPDLESKVKEADAEVHEKEARKQNRYSQMGMQLEYVPPSRREGKVIIQIEEEDVNELKEYWDNALIGYVLGDTPYEKSMVNYVESVWDFVDKPQILYHHEGYYVFRFSNVKDKEAVILSVGYWTADALSKVASRVGIPMYTDKYTAELGKISYARVLVKVDITKPLVESVEIITPTSVKQQEIVYEWKPRLCTECLHFGHDVFECWKSNKPEETEEFQIPKRRNKGRRRRIIQEWKPKEQQEKEEKQEETKGV
ncbi:PREDICTED: uncharacterized protein LOC109243031 [Nicotiana attenuata]|uniref:uncharacterized protein LOC109243031 n=1 Tax=Nicotiana attenuata TaxID=49451 RepID=UPI0009052A87|nr:PREDICTED: uncharacterized protein LOC109243031 [Nicotiana attenuata]